MEGIYISYDEQKRGNIEEAVEVANREYLIWRNPKAVKRKLKYPAKIIIRIKGQERYYMGSLLAVVDYKAFNPEFLKKYFRHRPSRWEYSPEKNWKSIFLITNLRATEKPDEIRNKYPPQGITYFKI